MPKAAWTGATPALPRVVFAAQLTIVNNSSAVVCTFLSMREASTLCTVPRTALEWLSMIPNCVCLDPFAGGMGSNTLLLSESHDFMASLPTAFSPSATHRAGKPQGSVHLVMPTRIAPKLLPVRRGSMHTKEASSKRCKFVQSRAGPSQNTVQNRMSSQTRSLNREARVCLTMFRAGSRSQRRHCLQVLTTSFTSSTVASGRLARL